jgi:Flp pilus assembly pilin Flp
MPPDRTVAQHLHHLEARIALTDNTSRVNAKEGYSMIRLEGVIMTRKIIGACKAIMRDESGQTMLEYIVIVVFVVIAAIIGFRLIKGIVGRSVVKASASIEQ